MRSSPKPSAGHGLSDSIHSTAESFELGAVLLTLDLLCLDHLARRLLGEARIGELALGTRELLAYALTLGLDVTRAVLARADDALEDAGGVAAQLHAHAAPPVDPRSELRVLERVEVVLVLALGLRPRRHDQPVVV